MEKRLPVPYTKKSDIEKLIELSKKNKENAVFNPYCDIHIGKGCFIPYTRELDKVKVTEIFLSADERKQHVGCIGTTGSGKTRLIMHMVTQDILAGNSVLIVDPKYDADLFARVIEAATIAGRLDEVIYFNPVVSSVSAKLNLLYSYYLPDEIVDHVVAGVRAREEYFENVAYEVTTAIVLGLYALAKAKGEKLDVNFYEIKKWCDHQKLGELYQSLEYLVYSNDPEIRQIALDVRMFIEQIRSSPADFFAKVSSSLRTVLTSLSASTIGDLVGKARQNEFIQKLESGERVIVYCNTGVLIMRKAAHILGRIIISMIQSLIGRLLARKAKLEPPLVLYLDEGQNVLYRGVEELFAKGRAANVWVNFFTQSISSLDSVIGKELARVIIDNISTWIFMRVNCEETAKYVENIFPRTSQFKKRFVPGGEGAMVVLGESEEPVFDHIKIMTLKQRRFLMKTASGKYYIGEVAEVPDPKITIIFPLEKSIPILQLQVKENDEKILH